MLLIPGYPESLEEIIFLCLRRAGASPLAAAQVNLIVVLETLQLPEEFVAPQEFLGREVKDSGDVLWSMVLLGGFFPVVSLSRGGRRERCCLNTEQP